MLYHPFVGIGIFDFDGCSGQWDNFPTFQILFLKPDEGGKGGVIENEIIGFTVLGNEHGEVRDKCLPRGPLGLMHHIQAVRHGFRLGETMGIGNQEIPFRFLGVLVASSTGKINLEFRTFLWLFNLHLIVGCSGGQRKNGGIGGKAGSCRNDFRHR